MAVEIGAVATDAVAAGNSRRGNQGGIGRHVVAGGASSGGMGLTSTDEGRAGGDMAAITVAGECSRIGVLSDLGAVVVGVSVKVVSMALGAGAALAAIDGGIAMAADAEDPGAVGAGVAACAGILVHCADDVAAVAGNAEGGAGHRGSMAVDV